MEESVLKSIKKLLGIAEDYTEFDTDIIIHINSVFMVLNQLGVGPSEGFSITGASETWTDYLGEGVRNLDSARSYVYLKVRLLFDPPTSTAALESVNKLVGELEWRLNVAAESSN